MNPCQLATLTSLTTLLIASPFLTQLSHAAQIRIAQESARGVGDFDAHILGYIETFSTGKTIQEFYGYNSGIPNSFDSAANGIDLSSGASNLFLVQASDGLGLFSVNSYNNQKTARIPMQFQLIGDTATLLVSDDPEEVRSQVSKPKKGPVKTFIYTKNSLQSKELTDGFAIGSLDGNWTILGEFSKKFSGVSNWVALSATGSSIPLNTTLKRNIRLDLVADPNPPQAVPEPLTLLGVSLAICFGTYFKKKSGNMRKDD